MEQDSTRLDRRLSVLGVASRELAVFVEENRDRDKRTGDPAKQRHPPVDLEILEQGRCHDGHSSAERASEKVVC